MSNRETFREDPLLNELFKKLQYELKWHEGLIELDRRRYEEKIKNATSDEDGINALEELLSTDPALADLFGSMMQGKVAAKTIAAAISGAKIEGEASKFEGTQFPSYFRRKDGATSVEIELPQNWEARASFLTDVKNNYFTRVKGKGKVEFSGDLEPTFRLFNGRLTFTFRAGKTKLPVGKVYDTAIVISDSGHGPWKLGIKVTIAPPREKEERESPEPQPPKTDAAPSRPNIIEVKHGPEGAPITVDKEPGSDLLQLAVNVESQMLVDAKAMREPTEGTAVEFVFKYGLALVAMGLLDAAKKTPEWAANEVDCRERVGKAAAGVAKVIVPLCLTLPQKLPKKLSKAA